MSTLPPTGGHWFQGAVSGCPFASGFGKADLIRSPLRWRKSPLSSGPHRPRSTWAWSRGLRELFLKSCTSSALGPGPEQKLFLLCLSSSPLRVCLVSSPVKHKCFHVAAYSAISEVNTSCYRSQLPWHLHVMSRGHWAQKKWEVEMYRDSSSKSQGIILKKRRGDNVGIQIYWFDLNFDD